MRTNVGPPPQEAREPRKTFVSMALIRAAIHPNLMLFGLHWLAWLLFMFPVPVELALAGPLGICLAPFVSFTFIGTSALKVHFCILWSHTGMLHLFSYKKTINSHLVPYLLHRATFSSMALLSLGHASAAMIADEITNITKTGNIND